jgi:hypothetical protein
MHEGHSDRPVISLRVAAAVDRITSGVEVNR